MLSPTVPNATRPAVVHPGPVAHAQSPVDAWNGHGGTGVAAFEEQNEFRGQIAQAIVGCEEGALDRLHN